MKPVKNTNQTRSRYFFQVTGMARALRDGAQFRSITLSLLSLSFTVNRRSDLPGKKREKNERKKGSRDRDRRGRNDPTTQAQPALVDLPPIKLQNNPANLPFFTLNIILTLCGRFHHSPDCHPRSPGARPQFSCTYLHICTSSPLPHLEGLPTPPCPCLRVLFPLLFVSIFLFFLSTRSS